MAKERAQENLGGLTRRPTHPLPTRTQLARRHHPLLPITSGSRSHRGGVGRRARESGGVRLRGSAYQQHEVHAAPPPAPPPHLQPPPPLLQPPPPGLTGGTGERQWQTQRERKRKIGCHGATLWWAGTAAGCRYQKQSVFATGATARAASTAGMHLRVRWTGQGPRRDGRGQVVVAARQRDGDIDAPPTRGGRQAGPRGEVRPLMQVADRNLTYNVNPPTTYLTFTKSTQLSKSSRETRAR